MTIRPTRATVAGRAYLDLQNLARRTGRPTDEPHQVYALEGFLARLAHSPYADRLVLKGGILMAAYAARRPTRDVDLQGRWISNETDQVLSVVRDVAGHPFDDGLVFDPATASAETIRDDDVYSGVRVSLAVARLTFHVDVNVGDPIWPDPQPIKLPRLCRVDAEGAAAGSDCRVRAGADRYAGHCGPDRHPDRTATRRRRSGRSSARREQASPWIRPTGSKAREHDVTIVLHLLSGRRDATTVHLQPGRLCVLTSRHRHACIVVARAGIGELLDAHPSTDQVHLDVPVTFPDGWSGHQAVLALLAERRARAKCTYRRRRAAC